jgi:maleylpyruvate isomerase
MMRLHTYYRSSASYRVRLVLAHKDLPFETVPVSLRDGVQLASSHLDKNPIGQVPVLEVEGENGPVFIAQSVAIIEYLEECYPERSLLPNAPLARARARELAELVNAGMQPFQNLATTNHVQQVLRADAKAWVQHFVGRGLNALERRARQTAGTFMLGDTPSIADVFLLPQLYGARRFEVSMEGLDTLLRVEARALALPRWEQAHPDRQPDADPAHAQ